MNKSVSNKEQNIVRSFPRDFIFSQLLQRMLDAFDANGIPTRNVVAGVGTKNARIMDTYVDKVNELYKKIVREEFGFSYDDLLLMRAVKDDVRLGVTDRLYEMCGILDVLLPRYNARTQEADAAHVQAHAVPLAGDPVMTLEQIVEMFINENGAYQRKTFGKVCLEMNTSILPRPTDEEIADLESAEGTWIIKQESTEGAALQAALNYSPSELKDANMPRFTYIASAMAPLREIADNSPRAKNNALAYVTGAANALYIYLAIQRGDDSDIEAGMLFSKYRNFRTNIGWHRDQAVSVLTRLSNGKPAYKDLINMSKRYYGIHFWGLDTLLRVTIPMLKPMYDCPKTRPEVIKWFDSCGVLEVYQQHKKFHRAHSETK